MLSQPLHFLLGSLHGFRFTYSTDRKSFGEIQTLQRFWDSHKGKLKYQFEIKQSELELQYLVLDKFYFCLCSTDLPSYLLKVLLWVSWNLEIHGRK